MTDIIKDKFKRKAIIYDNMWMYFIKTAKEVIKECEFNKINIVSLEAFSVTGNSIQPSQENSIDFNPNEENWNRAIGFLEVDANTDYIYEIWYKGY